MDSDNTNLGHVCLGIGEYIEAIDYYKIALEDSTKNFDARGIANSNGNLGSAYRCLGEYTKAIDYYEKGLEISTEIGDRSGIANMTSNLGNAYQCLGEFKMAIDYYKKGLEISTAIGDKSGMVSDNCNLGSAYLSQGEYQTAIDYYQKSLLINTEIKDRFAIAGNNGNLGSAYFRLGQYEKAIDYYNKALEISTEICNQSGIARINGNLGNVYLRLGECTKAIDYYKKALEISTAIGDQSARAINNSNLGNACMSLEEYEKAIDYFKKGLEISTAIGDKSKIASNNGNLGNAFQCLREYEKARCYLQEAIKISSSIDDKSAIATQNKNLGNVFLGLGKHEMAIDCYKIGLEISTAIKDKPGIASNNGNLGNAYRWFGNYPQATSYLMTSISCFDKIFLKSVPDQNKLTFPEQYFKIHVNLMRCFIALGRIESALLVIDLGKAKELHCQIERRGLSMDMFSYARTTWNRIENNEERIDAEGIQKILHAGDDTSILVFAFDFEGILNVWILNGKIIFRPLQLDKNLLAVLINILLGRLHVNVNRNSSFYKIDSNSIPKAQALVPKEMKTRIPELENTGNSSGGIGNISNTEILDTLYQLLVLPVKDVIKGNKLIIVPDKQLFFAPFSSLIDENGSHLSNSYSIQISPSLHTLTYSMSRLHETNLGYAFFVGNPTVGKVVLNEQELTPSDLPGAAEEVKYLSHLFETRPLLGCDATKQRVLELLSGASVIHIAAHGEPNKGEIMLSPNPSLAQPCSSLPKPDSYLLRQRDIESISAKARLVVLCCCHTGQGEISSEGVVGITRAFLAAGARSVLAALWPISDHGTKEFMEKFYDELFQGTSVCEALRRTMNLFQTRESFEVWAPFTIYGEDVKFSKQELDEIKKQSKFLQTF